MIRSNTFLSVLRALATRLILCTLMVFLGAPDGRAQDSARISAIEDAWRDWMGAHNARNGTLAIGYRGKIVHEIGIGQNASDTVTLASLSKAITGACVQHLIKQGKLRVDTTLAEVFGTGLKALGLTSSAFGDLRIEELLSHASGLMPDSTQEDMSRWRGQATVRHEEVARAALGRSTQTGTRGKYSYNNENYAILGAVVSHLSGQPYATYCRNAVLAPAGANTARLSADFGGYAAWGGWEMSAADFSRFVMQAYGPDTAIAKDPLDFAHVVLNPGVHYGTGVLFRHRAGRSNFWHFGLLCFGRRDNRGSYFAYWGGGWTVTATYAICPDWDKMLALDQALGTAALR